MGDRRDFLTAAAGLATAGSGSSMTAAAAQFTPGPGHIVRENQPPNLESPLDQLAADQTSTAAFFVRNHFPTPAIDLANWRLRVEGAVERPAEFSYADLAALPQVTKSITLECAGNGRVFLTPKVRGVNWSQGAVGNAAWTGPTLAALLAKTGIKANAVEVVLEGADVGTHVDEPKSPGPIAYARSIPLAKGRSGDVLLALKMNDEQLTPDHGWPVRAIVGGWYGMASVKWLTRIVVAEQAYQGYWQTMDYSQFDRVNGLPTLAPITGMRVKSLILAPRVGEVLPARQDHTITGRAWAGESAVVKVEVSTDGGETWQAQTGTIAEPMQWGRWSVTWKAPTPGTYRLMARATDAAGNTQPMTRDPDRRTYQINHVIPVEVTVR